MPRTLLVFVILFLAANLTRAQSAAPDVTPDARVTSEQIARWMYSGDPRLIAWAAHFAAQQHDTANLSLLPALLDQATPISPTVDGTDQASYNRYREASALLHAIILTGHTAPSETLAKLAEVFPVAALVLASRLPVPDRTPLLLRWYRLADQTHGGQLTRISAMLLAKSPPPGFAAEILATTTASLRIAVTSPNSGYGFAACSGGCGDGASGSPDTTWPPLFGYHLQATNLDPKATLLVEAGDLRIFYVSVPFYSGYGHCGDDQPDFHHAVLSQMLAIPEKTMSWQTLWFRNVEWVDAAQFTTAVQQFVAAERVALNSTAADLARKGLITAADGDPRPRLVVTIDDHRESPSAPLPALHFDDPQTTLAEDNSPAP